MLSAMVDAARLLVQVHRLALQARAVDERLWILARQGRVNFVLTARGHEIAQIASALTLRPGHDTAWFYYRDLAAALTLGVTPYEIFLGALARAADPHSGGRQLTAHFSSPRLGIGTVSSVVAGGVPHAVGAAWAARLTDSDAVAMSYFGEGAASEGVVHESMNLAGIQRLPVVFFCENNGYAISVPLAEEVAGGSVAARAAAYGLPGVTVDGGDALAVHQATCAAIARARRGDGPSVIEARVWRITPHSSQDDDAYRSDDELAAARAADPLPLLQQILLDRQLLTPAQAQAAADAIREAVVADELRALAQPEPSPARARRWLFAGDPPHPGIGPCETER
jgi:2-oxoisovalerate dehydrogenase E1 component alpha subunit